MCSSLTSLAIPDGVTSIGNYAFQTCSSLIRIVIPNSVTSIGRFAFESCSSLTRITIPDSVTSIGNWAFFNCSSLKSVTFEDLNGWYVTSGSETSIIRLAYRDLSNPATAAEYLSDRYIGYYWHKDNT